ncbi:hypothetical protein [Streptosporangium sp. V21-05]
MIVFAKRAQETVIFLDNALISSLGIEAYRTKTGTLGTVAGVRRPRRSR